MKDVAYTLSHDDLNAIRDKWRPADGSDLAIALNQCARLVGSRDAAETLAREYEATAAELVARPTPGTPDEQLAALGKQVEAEADVVAARLVRARQADELRKSWNAVLSLLGPVA